MNIFWIWEDKPEIDYCSNTTGKFGETYDRETVLQLARNKPLEKPWPGLEIDDLTFEYDKQKRYPADYVNVNSGYFVASEKLRKLFEYEGVQAEYFPVNITDSKLYIESSYWLVHILSRYEVSDVLDYEKSAYSYDEKLGKHNAKSIVFRDDRQPESPLFILAGLYQLLASNKLKQAVESEGITGVYFMSTEEYQDKYPPIYGAFVKQAVDGYKKKYGKR